MKKNILIFTLLLGLLSSKITVSSEESPQNQTLGQILAKALATVAGNWGLDYLYDKLQKYLLPETRQAKMARMQEALLEAEYSKLLPNPDITMNKPVEQINITFADYIDVPNEAIKLVQQIKNPERFIKAGVPLPHGILITGDPGTGKTHLARAIAGEVECPFFVYPATRFIQGLIGEGQRLIEQAYNDARETAKRQEKNVAIIFIDEFDTIGSRSGGSSDGLYKQTQEGLINTFLTEIDGFNKDNINVITIAATNYPKNLDSALKRKGRFDITIHISYPNETARKVMITEKMKSTKINSKMRANLADRLANITEGLSQAELSALFIDAAIKSIEKNIDETGADYDCFVRALWDMKKANREKELPPRSDKEELIQTFFNRMGISNISRESLLAQMTSMTLLDIEEVFGHAYKFSQTRPEKTLAEWLQIAIQAKNQQIHIRQNREIVHLCSKIYAIETNYSKKDLIEKQPDDIFKHFENLYTFMYLPDSSSLPS